MDRKDPFHKIDELVQSSRQQASPPRFPRLWVQRK